AQHSTAQLNKFLLLINNLILIFQNSNTVFIRVGILFCICLGRGAHEDWCFMQRSPHYRAIPHMRSFVL
ncbi:MAG: hypothetical protein II969_02605, partial [Anaerolineaceae bacterium]|nr:hypothetical protein [Anaerolineaceae bacterium]